MQPTMSVNIGDWVYSYSPGVWKVFRVLQGVQRLRFKSQERKRVNRQRIVICKRLVDELWKPAFAAETCDASLLRPLSAEDKDHLERFTAEHPEVVREFDAFQPKNMDFAMDLRLNVPSSVGKDRIQTLVNDAFTDIGAGLTNDEILQRLDTSRMVAYITEMSGNAILRFLCKDRELRGNEYVFREVVFLMV